MFNVSYDYAKQEVARRHEKLAEAQRTGVAYAYRPRRVNLRVRVAAWFRRQPSGDAATTAPTASATGEPFVTC